MNNSENILGKLILFGQDIGIVRYVGPVAEISNDSEIWYGIEWKEPARGKHDGFFKGKRYFQTKHPTGGSFINPKKVNFGVDIWTAVEDKYFKNDDVDIQKNQFNGNKDQDQILYNNFDISNITSTHRLTQMFPFISEMDLEGNLLKSWNQVFAVLNELKNLKLINVSNNILPLPDISEKRTYENIKHLILNRMNYNWDDVLTILKHFPKIVELKVCFNSIDEIESVNADLMENLKILDLESNPIKQWKYVLKLGELKRLETLFANNIGITEINFPDSEQTSKFFPSLEWLSLINNQISEWYSINELNKLCKLVEVSFKFNPLNNSDQLENIRELFIAKIERLEIFNRSRLERNERKGAEIDYLKKFGSDWFEVCDETKPNNKEKRKEFIKMHPRYYELIKKHGAIEKSEINHGQETINSKLISINLRNESNGQVLQKKLPLSMDIQRLKFMVCKLFKQDNYDFESLSLFYTNSQTSGSEYELDNNMRILGFYALENGDTIIARKINRE